MAAPAFVFAPTVSAAQATTYNQAILNDAPVMFLGMDTASTGAQADLTGHGHNGTYVGGAPASTALPNGDKAAVFNGSSQYLTVPSNAALSVPTAKALTIEAWIKPGTLQFPHSESEGYVYFLGKGDPTHGYEYANRMYSYTNTAGRPNRISDYDWNVSGGLGSGAYFQDTVTTTDWIFVTDVINMNTGYIDIYKNGVLRGHVPLSQYSVTPGVTQAPFNVGTRNMQSWFLGAIGKVAVYGKALTASQIAAHYAAMSAAGSGSTTPAPTPTAPVASAVSATNLTQTGATINWTTDKASYSQVEYGVSTSYGASSAQTATAATAHSVALSGLTAGTVYHYRVKSYDPTTQLTGVSADATFTTAAAAPAPTPTPTPVAAGCSQATANTWANAAETSQNGQFTLAFDATPSQSLEDAVLGASNGAAAAYSSMATIVRFNNTGTIDARNGSAYAAAAAIPYTGGKSYHFRLVINVTNHTYSAYVTPAGGTELTIGSNYAFRTEQAAATALNNLALNTTVGAVQACNASVAAVAAPVATTTSGSTSTSGSTAISNVKAAVTSTGATITWQTTTVSHSQVEYGLTSAYGTLSYQSTATGNYHSIPLSGLKAGTTYHYRVKSLNSSTGQTDVSGDYTFTTPGTAA